MGCLCQAGEFKKRKRKKKSALTSSQVNETNDQVHEWLVTGMLYSGKWWILQNLMSLHQDWTSFRKVLCQTGETTELSLWLFVHQKWEGLTGTWKHAKNLRKQVSGVLYAISECNSQKASMLRNELSVAWGVAESVELSTPSQRCIGSVVLTALKNLFIDCQWSMTWICTVFKQKRKKMILHHHWSG